MVSEEMLYSKEVPEKVALYITAHGGRVQTERAPFAWVFHKVTFLYTSYRWISGDVGVAPTYRYTLQDGAEILVTFHNKDGGVPGHPASYWVTISKDGSKCEREDQ